VGSKGSRRDAAQYGRDAAQYVGKFGQLSVREPPPGMIALGGHLVLEVRELDVDRL
jgi:hypothetical protein